MSPLAPGPRFRPLLFRRPAPQVGQGGISATRRRGHPALWRPAWPSRPRSHCRGCSCAPGTSGSRSRWQPPARAGLRSPSLPVGRRSGRAGFIMGHAGDRRREDPHSAESPSHGPLRRNLESTRDGGALRVVSLLVEPHMGLPPCPAPPLPPSHRVSHRPRDMVVELLCSGLQLIDECGDLLGDIIDLHLSRRHTFVILVTLRGEVANNVPIPLS